MEVFSVRKESLLLEEVKVILIDLIGVVSMVYS